MNKLITKEMIRIVAESGEILKWQDRIPGVFSDQERTYVERTMQAEIDELRASRVKMSREMASIKEEVQPIPVVGTAAQTVSVTEQKTILGERITNETYQLLCSVQTWFGTALTLLPTVSWNESGRAACDKLSKLLQRNFGVQLNEAEAKQMGYDIPPAITDAMDAARWRALLGSARIRILGSAGLKKPEANNYAHFGMEIWTRYSRDFKPELLEEMDRGNETAKELITKYADIAIAAANK